MQIVPLQTFSIPTFPEFVAGETYEVPNELGRELIGRELVVIKPQEKEEHKKPEKKHSK